MLVSENSLVKVEPDLPLARRRAGRPAAWPPASARPPSGPGTKPGDNVAVIGIGGIGINAVQGARIAGAKRVIAIDPVEFKREKAMEFGATHTYASIDEAHARGARPDLGRHVRPGRSSAPAWCTAT